MSSGPDIPEDLLRAMVMAALEENRLPLTVNGRVKASYGGVGSTCEVCGEAIQWDQIEYEATDARDRRPLSFHLRCHRAWQAECIRRAAKKT